MDAKEAIVSIDYFKERISYCDNWYYRKAIEALEKVPVLEAENARMLAMLKHFTEDNNCSACPISKFCKEQKELISCKDVILAYVNGQAIKNDKE